VFIDARCRYVASWKMMPIVWRWPERDPTCPVAQLSDEPGQGIDEVLVFSAAEAVPDHDDMASKAAAVLVQGGEGAAAVRVEIGLDARPVVVLMWQLLPRGGLKIEPGSTLGLAVSGQRMPGRRRGFACPKTASIFCCRR
jgi:hypothetical protein